MAETLRANGALPGADGRAQNFFGGGVSAPEGALRYRLAQTDSGAYGNIAQLPGDTLLRLLHWGMAHHRLGKWEASNQAFQHAEQIAEDRYTKSVSQALGAALINDKTLDYVPAPHERAFMHYYGMLNYLQLGDRDAALVESRKANAFLERYTRENGHRSYAADAAVQYLSGMLQLANNERDNAIVSLRKAGEAYDVYRGRYGVPSPRFVGEDIARTASQLGIAEVANDISREYGLTAADLAPKPGSGQLLVLVENGFVAHRVQQKLYVPILGSEASLMSTGGPAVAPVVALTIVDRTLTLFQEANKGNEYAKAYQDGYVLGAIVTGGDVFSVAWPKYALHANAAQSVVVTAGTARQEALLMNDLSAIAGRHFEEEKDRILRRAIFRAAGKFALVKVAEKKAEQAAARSGGGFWGQLAGAGAKALGQAAATASEQADTRTWSTLPAEIRAARFTLPAGEHEITLTVTDADGSIQKLDLGTVSIAANQLEVRSAFVTGTSRGATTRFARAVEGADLRATATVASGVLPSAVPPAGTALAGAPAAGAAAAAQPAPPPPAVTAATIVAVRPIASAFRPLAGESARFAVAMRGAPTAEQRGPASIELFAVREGTTDTTMVWSGVEGDTIVWNGMLDAEPAQPGVYTWIARATTPFAPAPTQYVWTAPVALDAPSGRELLVPPPAPELEPETRLVWQPDYAKKRSRWRTGLIVSVIGIGATTAGYSMASSAIESSEPGSSQRQMAFNTWLGGIAVTSIGAIVASRGWFKDYEHQVREPDGGAVQRNQDARDAHARAVADVEEKNARIKESVMIRVGPVAAQRPGRRP